MQNGWKEGGVLSATIFCIYMDELISRLERSGIGCYIGNEYYGNISDADDLKLLVLIVYTGWVQIYGDVNIRVDIHGYDTQSSENIDLYEPRVVKQLRKSCSYVVETLWNELPIYVYKLSPR